MKWEQHPPYHVLYTPQFSAKDLAKAEKLAKAVHLFYNEGRAVPWFNTILFPLHKRASVFFEEFSAFLAKNSVRSAASVALSATDSTAIESTASIDRLQMDFVRAQYREKHLEKILPAVEDSIAMNNALSRCTADGTESIVTLHYHPDDIMSEYATDVQFFVQHCGREKCRVRVFSGKNGVDWRVEKS